MPKKTPTTKSPTAEQKIAARAARVKAAKREPKLPERAGPLLSMPGRSRCYLDVTLICAVAEVRPTPEQEQAGAQGFVTVSTVDGKTYGLYTADNQTVLELLAAVLNMVPDATPSA